MAGPGRGRLRSYVKLPTDHLFDDAFLELPDPVLAAFLVAWSWAARQPERGFFRSDRVLREYIGSRRSRALPKLYAAGLLYRLPDRRVEVVGYAEMHEGDATADDRNAAARARRKAVSEALESGGPANTVPAPSTVTTDRGEGATFNRNDHVALPVTQYPLPGTPSDVVPLRVVPSAHEAEGSAQPSDDQSTSNHHRGLKPQVAITEQGAVEWLSWLWKRPPSDDQLESLREVVSRHLQHGGWEWVIKRFDAWLGLDRDEDAYRDPITYVFECDKRWQQKQRTAR